MNYFNEVQRKSIHLFSLSIPLGYYYLPTRIAVAILIGVSFFFILGDILRLYHEPAARLFYRFFTPLLRDHERERRKLTGSTYLFIGSLLCIFLFEKMTAVVALTFLIVSDTAAALVGRGIGRHKIFDKTIEGSGAFFISAILIVILWRFPFLPGLAGALVGTFLELLPVRWDDNLVIPLGSGFTMQVILYTQTGSGFGSGI